MNTINKIPRPVQILIVIAILAILVWRFAPARLLYPSIIAAGLITLGTSAWIYRSGIGKSQTQQSGKTDAEIQDEVDSQADNADLDDERPVSPVSNYSKMSGRSPRLQATDVAARYRNMAAAKSEETEQKNGESKTARLTAFDFKSDKMTDEVDLTETVTGSEPAAAAEGQNENESAPGEPPMPIITDVSILTEEDKSQLENAVWYRCENPFCKYTHFLDVHHIIDEKEGGTNKLENLIVLCPYCHDLAHRSEIPEKEMCDWISNRDERFKFKLEWHY